MLLGCQSHLFSSPAHLPLHPDLFPAFPSRLSAAPLSVIQLLRPRALCSPGVTLFLSLPHLICQKFMSALPPKCIQNLTLSHHLPLSSGFRPLHPCPLQSSLNTFSCSTTRLSSNACKCSHFSLEILASLYRGLQASYNLAPVPSLTCLPLFTPHSLQSPCCEAAQETRWRGSQGERRSPPESPI